jgi:general secretion pathway protein E
MAALPGGNPLLAVESVVFKDSLPASLLASAFVVAGGLFLLDFAGIASARTSATWIGATLALSAGALILAKYVRSNLARPVRAIPRLTEIEAHSPAQIRAFIDDCARKPDPDIPYLIDYLLHQAIQARASDIHLLPYERFATVRYRIDGIIEDVGELPASLKDAMTNRLKVLSSLNPFIHDRPQDGRFEFAAGERRLDVRSAFMPTLHGERTVLRILNRAEVGLSLATLGFTPEQMALFLDILRRPQGMIILNGPTGSGKTTTIYCALNAILDQSDRSRSIYTLEDPIEYDLLRINQTQIEESQGFTFAHGLKSMLRQDPDVIMVGEIRDLETARIALQAGLTGHLIITTVHANDAVSVFVRLIEIGADPHGVASAVTAVIGQRLVRALCPDCRRPERPTPGQAAQLGSAVRGATVYGAVGCPRCNMKGYLGRKGLFEILEVTEALQPLIVSRAAPAQIQRESAKRGTQTLTEVGLAMALRGETSLDEVIRVAPPAGKHA